jgi:hypothetical protein
MFALLKVAALASVVGVSALSAGCQSSGGQTKVHAHEAGIMCNKCEVKWTAVTTPSYAKGSAVMTQTSKRQIMTCPECKNTAEQYFAAGKIAVPGVVVHSCKSCGGDMTACDAH